MLSQKGLQQRNLFCCSSFFFNSVFVQIANFVFSVIVQLFCGGENVEHLSTFMLLYNLIEKFLCILYNFNKEIRLKIRRF